MAKEMFLSTYELARLLKYEDNEHCAQIQILCEENSGDNPINRELDKLGYGYYEESWNDPNGQQQYSEGFAMPSTAALMKVLKIELEPKVFWVVPDWQIGLIEELRKENRCRRGRLRTRLIRRWGKTTVFPNGLWERYYGRPMGLTAAHG